MASAARRRVLSYVLRQGRMTSKQTNALEKHWAKYGIDFDPHKKVEWPRDTNSICINNDDNDDDDRNRNSYDSSPALRVLEIGTGMGDGFVELAAKWPEVDFLGVEVFVPGVGAALSRTAAEGLQNVRVINHDVHDVLEYMIPDASLDAVHVFFPDPWPKKRHHKRRLLTPSFVDKLLAPKLRPGALIHVATDWADSAEHAAHALEASSALENVCGPCLSVANDNHDDSDDDDDDETQSPPPRFVQRPDWRPLSKFEKRGLAAGRTIYNLCFRRRVALGEDTCCSSTTQHQHQQQQQHTTHATPPNSQTQSVFRLPAPPPPAM